MAADVNDKQVINDNIRVDDLELKSTIKRVQKRRERIRQRLSKKQEEDAFLSQYTGESHVTMDPPAGKQSLVPRAVIIYLIGKKIEHFLDLLDSLHSLKINFLDQNPYPIILFHEGLNQTQMEAVLKHYDDVRFHRLDKEFLFPPEHVNFSKVWSFHPIVVIVISSFFSQGPEDHRWACERWLQAHVPVLLGSHVQLSPA